RLGTAHSFPRLDDPAVLVLGPAVRVVARHLQDAWRTRSARKAPGGDPIVLDRVLLPVPTTLHFRASSRQRNSGRSLWRPHEFRQAVQPGAVAACESGGYLVDALSRAHRRRNPEVRRRLVRANGAVHADHLSA